MQPYLQNLGLKLTNWQIEKINLLGNSMLADPIYKSVSKIFEPEDIALKHFLDSIAPLKFDLVCWKKAEQVVDLGTGGGFPLLPLAIMKPECRFLGVDSRQKSVEFVARMAEATGLENVRVKHARIEELGRDSQHREKNDLVICRALSAVRTLLEYTLPLTRDGGFSLYFKGPRLEQEIADAATAMRELGVAEGQLSFYELSEPEIPFSRGYLLVEKKNSVPAKYPRKNGLPSSRPL
jgi:16S rRNA (guanine527-N7)-methyltransferase